MNYRVKELFNIQGDGLRGNNEPVHYFLKALYLCSRFINLELPLHAGMLNNPSVGVCVGPWLIISNILNILLILSKKAYKMGFVLLNPSYSLI